MTMMPWLQNPNAQQKPGLGGQLASKAASNLAAEQATKLGLGAAGTAFAGPLGGALGSAAGELAGPLAGQLVGNLFNRGGPVWSQSFVDRINQQYDRQIEDARARGHGPQSIAGLEQAKQGVIAKYNRVTGGPPAPQSGPTQEEVNAQLLAKGLSQSDADKVKAAGEAAGGINEEVIAQALAPAAPDRAVGGKSGGSGSWNIPLGSGFLGADWSTSGDYSAGTKFDDGTSSGDSWNAGIKGTWTFDKGGEVPGNSKSSIWDSVKKAAQYAWKNDNKPGDRWAARNKPEYKNIGGMTKGPLGMPDMLAAGKGKDVSKVKMKKNKGDMAEEVEVNYHAPLAPKPTGE